MVTTSQNSIKNTQHRKKRKEKKRKKIHQITKEDREKETKITFSPPKKAINKLCIVNPYLSVMNLNVNGQNLPAKRAAE
jgi:hypothetical protein